MQAFRVMTPIALLLATTPLFADELVPVGENFVVNAYTTSDQGFPHLAAAEDGSFVAVWESYSQDLSGFGIFGRRLDANGQPIGAEFPVNTFTTDNQFDPIAAVAPSGEFMVVWASPDQDGSNFGIFGQRFDAAGAAAGSEFAINTHTTSSQNYPSVAANSAGDFMVVWTSAGQDQSFSGVFGQRYDSQGMPLGDEFRVNTTTLEEQDDTRVAAQGDGFVVVWESQGIDGSGDAVMMQRYDSAGLPVGDETQVNSSMSNDQEDPDVASLADGTFAVVWESDGQDGSGETAVAQVYSSTGVALGGEIVLNVTQTGDQEDPRVSRLTDDQFLAVWKGPGPNDEVWARRFDVTGQALGEEFQINTVTAFPQDRVVVASNGQGRALTAWRSFGDADGDLAGVLGQRYELGIFADGFESGDFQAWASSSP